MDIPKSWTWRDEKRHLVAFVKDEGTELVVYKHWLTSKQRWAYRTEPKAIIEYELTLIQREQ